MMFLLSEGIVLGIIKDFIFLDDNVIEFNECFIFFVWVEVRLKVLIW